MFKVFGYVVRPDPYKGFRAKYHGKNLEECEEARVLARPDEYVEVLSADVDIAVYFLEKEPMVKFESDPRFTFATEIHNCIESEIEEVFQASNSGLVVARDFDAAYNLMLRRAEDYAASFDLSVGYKIGDHVRFYREVIKEEDVYDEEYKDNYTLTRRINEEFVGIVISVMNSFITKKKKVLVRGDGGEFLFDEDSTDLRPVPGKK